MVSHGPADRATDRRYERIVEFTLADGSAGGLISICATDDGSVRIGVYRCDGSVVVDVGTGATLAKVTP